MIIKLDQHINRFFDSLRAARLESSLSREGWREVIIETVRLNALKDASIRFIFTGGVPQGFVADPRVITPTEIVWAAPYIFLTNEQDCARGIRMMISATRGFSPGMLDPRFRCLERYSNVNHVLVVCSSSRKCLDAIQ